MFFYDLSSAPDDRRNRLKTWLWRVGVFYAATNTATRRVLKSRLVTFHRKIFRFFVNNNLYMTNEKFRPTFFYSLGQRVNPETIPLILPLISFVRTNNLWSFLDTSLYTNNFITKQIFQYFKCEHFLFFYEFCLFLNFGYENIIKFPSCLSWNTYNLLSVTEIII